MGCLARARRSCAEKGMRLVAQLQLKSRTECADVVYSWCPAIEAGGVPFLFKICGASGHNATRKRRAVHSACRCRCVPKRIWYRGHGYSLHFGPDPYGIACAGDLPGGRTLSQLARRKSVGRDWSSLGGVDWCHGCPACHRVGLEDNRYVLACRSRCMVHCNRCTADFRSPFPSLGPGPRSSRWHRFTPRIAGRWNPGWASHSRCGTQQCLARP